MKRLPYIFVILLTIPFVLGAAPPGSATLTLNTSVNTIFLHGFFGPEILLADSGDVIGRHIFGQFFPEGTDPADFDLPADFVAGRDKQLDYEDIEDFDFGEEDYEIGYYLFFTNVVGNYTVSFAISPFYSLNNDFTVPWTLQVDYEGGNTSFTGSEDFDSGGSMGFDIGSPVADHVIFQTGASAVQKFAALKLKMVTSFGGSPYEASLIPGGNDYIATVVASITGP